MGDGARTFTITMTHAQYDVLRHAIDQVLDDWTGMGRDRGRDRHTLMRAMAHIDEQFDTGIRQ